MATYFHGNPTEFQAPDGLQTLVLMNPTTYVQQQQQQFSDGTAPAPPPTTHNSLIFFNSSALSPHAPPHPPPHTQHFVGIPTTTTTTTHHQDDTVSSLHGLLPRVHYNFYNQNNYPSPPVRDTPRAKQGLSLSLSSQQQQPGFGHQAVSGEDIRVSGGSVSSGSGVTNGVSSIQSVLLSSKYLKAAQELLDEVVNVNNNSGINNNKSEFSKKGSSGNNTSISNKMVGDSSAAAGDDTDEGAGKRAAELTTAERQEIQMKKAKLINMLDEVDQRYRQYHHQMQIVISSFEQAAGIGSGKTYTSLALKTISKQFRCLKDAITGQIKAANKMLGEEESIGGKIEGSRLKFVDHHLRQQRALQQLGMLQNNAWRPQRGLPERSVSVLRAWLFEHFLHPYPKDSDKQMLAKQTGLTRSQVSNWFINARVRLWKPMVEEMYLEELKEQEQNGSEDKTSKSDHNEDSASKSTEKNLVNQTLNTKSFKSFDDNLTSQNVHSVISMSKIAASPIGGGGGGNSRNQSGFSLIGSSELEGLTQGSPKKLRNNDMNMMLSASNVQSISIDVKPGCGEANDNDQISMKFDDDDDDDDRQSRDGYAFIGNQMNFIQGFGQYPIGEIGRFDAEQFTPRFSGNGVSLTLGLPHCENLSLSATHQNFLPNQSIQLGRRVEIGEPNEFGTINTQSPHSSAAYESINIQNRKRFAAQLLPDFVT